MKTHTAGIVLALTLVMSACATTKSQLREQEWAENPVVWPVGMYDVTGHVSFSNPYVSRSESRTHHATLLVDPGNVLRICGEVIEVKGDRTGLGCEGGSFALFTDGERIWGTVTRTVRFQRPTSEVTCAQYRTDENGNRTCVRWDRPHDRTGYETATGQLNVTVKG